MNNTLPAEAIYLFCFGNIFSERRVRHTFGPLFPPLIPGVHLRKRIFRRETPAASPPVEFGAAYFGGWSFNLKVWGSLFFRVGVYPLNLQKMIARKLQGEFPVFQGGSFGSRYVVARDFLGFPICSSMCGYVPGKSAKNNKQRPVLIDSEQQKQLDQTENNKYP